MLKRFRYVDAFKGIGILLMIAGHTGYIGLANKFFSILHINMTIDQYVHAFHMPLFFVASGFLYNKKYDTVSFKHFTDRKIRTLIRPYAIIGFIHWLIWILVNHGTEQSFYNPLLNLLLFKTKDLPICNSIWFLPTLFITESLWFCVRKGIKNDRLVCLSTLLVGIVSSFLVPLLPFSPNYALFPGLVGLGFFAVGYWIRNNCSDFRVSKLAVATAVTVFMLSSFFASLNSVNMRIGKYGNVLLFWLCAVGICIPLFFLLKYLYDYYDNTNKPANVLFKLVEEIGRKSIIYVCFNQSVIPIIQAIIPIPTGIGIYIYRTIVFIGSVAILYSIQIIFDKTRLKWIVGAT